MDTNFEGIFVPKHMGHKEYSFLVDEFFSKMSNFKIKETVLYLYFQTKTNELNEFFQYNFYCGLEKNQSRQILLTKLLELSISKGTYKLTGNYYDV